MPYVFDADVHIHEEPRELAPFCEMPWRVALENEGSERWLDVPGYSPLTPLDPILGDRPETDVHVVRTPDELRADLDARGVDAALMVTDYFVGLASSQNADYAVSIAAAYNRYLRERWIDPARGLYGAVLLAGQDPAAAAEELRECARTAGVAAALLTTINAWPLYGDRQYEPIFAAAAETGLPLVFHGATSYGTVFPWQLQSYESPLARGALAQPLAAIANLTSIVTNGVLARHPRLKLLFCEAGVGWLPFLTARLDGQWRHLRSHAPELVEPPSAYVQRQVWTTSHPLDGDADALRGVGTERVVFASDWPHFDADETQALTQLSLPAEQAANIMGENARALFRLADQPSART